MKSKRWTILRRIVRYEYDYLLRKFQPFEIVVFALYLIPAIITGLGDTQSFFMGDNSLIPNTWVILKNPKTILIISIIILSVPVLLGQLQKNTDKSELLETIQQNVVPGINLALEVLQKDIMGKFSLQKNLRISLWIPVRIKTFDWNLQMVCKTHNVPDKELNASFGLDEGVIGYTYLKNNRKYSLEYIDVSNPSNLPESYVSLQSDNQILINSDIKGVLALASFQNNSTLGLLAIDTDNIDDLSIINDPKLHDMAVDWIVEYSGVIKLLWRMKNNV